MYKFLAVEIVISYKNILEFLLFLEDHFPLLYTSSMDRYFYIAECDWSDFLAYDRY